MVHHMDQPSSHVPTHLDELQLAVLTQQSKPLIREIQPFEVKNCQLSTCHFMINGYAKMAPASRIASNMHPLTDCGEGGGVGRNL